MTEFKDNKMEWKHITRLSKDGKYIILQSIGTAIYSTKYFKKIVESSDKLTTIDPTMPVEKAENVKNELDTLFEEVK